MKREELEALAVKYQGKADRAYRNYQETGIGRYDREYRNSEDLADALRMAARAADDAHKLVDLRVTLSTLGSEAARIRRNAWSADEVNAFLNKVISAARIRDLIREE